MYFYMYIPFNVFKASFITCFHHTVCPCTFRHLRNNDNHLPYLNDQIVRQMWRSIQQTCIRPVSANSTFIFFLFKSLQQKIASAPYAQSINLGKFIFSFFIKTFQSFYDQDNCKYIQAAWFSENFFFSFFFSQSPCRTQCLVFFPLLHLL